MPVSRIATSPALPLASGAPRSLSSLNEDKTSPGDPRSAEQSRDIQLRYELASTTFKALCTIQPAPTRQQVLRTACLATEFRSFPLRQAEKSFFRELNDHSAIPYPLQNPISQPWQKVFLLVQASLLQEGWPNKVSATARKELLQDDRRICILLDKVLRCIADILGERFDGRGLSVTLDVLRSIGPAKFQKLADAGIKSIKALANLEFYHIERLLSRNPPFGQQMLHQLKGFPRLEMNFSLLGRHEARTETGQALPHHASTTTEPVVPSSKKQLWIARVLLGYFNEQLPAWGKRVPWATLVIEGEDRRLVWFWRGSLKRLTDRKELLVAIDICLGETIQLTFACEGIVGTLKRDTFKVAP